MAVIFTRAHVPAGLENEWLQHLRDFDTAHPGCVFKVMMDPAPERSMEEIVEMLRVTPALTFQQVFERTQPGQQEPDCTICNNDCPYMPGGPLPPPECRIRQIAEELRREMFNGDGPH